MNVLVAYATAHGSGKAIAQTIGDVLETQGVTVTVEDVRNITRVDVEDYLRLII